MEDSRILSYRRWPLFWKVEAAASLGSAGFTLLVVALKAGSAPHQPFSVLDVLLAAVSWPTGVVSRAVGHELWPYTGQEGWSMKSLCVMVVLNSLLGSLAGLPIGWLARKLALKRETSEEAARGKAREGC